MGVNVARIPLVVAEGVRGRLWATVLAEPLGSPAGVPPPAAAAAAAAGSAPCIVGPRIMPGPAPGGQLAARVCGGGGGAGGAAVLGESALATCAGGAAGPG